MGSVTHKPGQEGKKKEENKGLWVSKAVFLPSWFCLHVWCPKRAMHIPRVVGILFLFRSSVSSKHFAINGVKTNKSLLLNPCVFV